jgi:hypothetical protein
MVEQFVILRQLTIENPDFIYQRFGTLLIIIRIDLIVNSEYNINMA